MQIPFLDLNAQYESIKQEINTAIEKVIHKSAYIGGEFVKSFNDEFAGFLHVKHAIGVGNGTDAITIALKALGISKGDEVIIPANSFIATAEAVSNAGAEVVFADCDPQIYTIDVTKLEAYINNRTKCIIPVHLYGQPAEMDEIMRIAHKYNLYVVEDSAQAHGATYHGKEVGTIGDIGTFSFYPGKNLGAYGDGGAIVTNDYDIAVFCTKYANHGRLDKYNHEFEGVNSRLDGLQAAILSVKLKHLIPWNIRRRQIAEFYAQELGSIQLITIPGKILSTESVYHLFVIRVKDRTKLVSHLSEKGIQTGIHYPIGLPFLRAYKYKNHKPEDFPVTWQYQNEILSIPIFPEMSDKMVEKVVDKICEFYVI